MSVADRAVRLIARTLPAPIRARYREEWRADAAAAAELGMSAASVAAGAAVFSLTLDRDLPSVSGFSLPEQSRRHARWALVLAGLAGLLVVARFPIAELGLSTIPASVLLALAAVVQLWAAARLSSGLARTAAALGTTGLLIFAAASTIPVVVSDAVPGSRHLPIIATVLLAAAAILGVAVWVRGLRPLVPAAIAALPLGIVVATPWLPFVPPVGVVPLTAATVLIGIALQTRLTAAEAPRRARTVVAVSSAVLLVLVGLAAFENLVLTPLRISGGDLDLAAVYALLPDGQGAIVQIAVWAAASVAAVLVYLAVGLRLAPRWGARQTVLLGAALGAALLLLANEASFSLFEQSTEAFVKFFRNFVYPEPRIGLYLHVVSVVLLAVAAVGWVAPRAPREVPSTAK